MTPEEFKKHLASLSINIRKAVNNDLPKKIGVEAVRMFSQNFQQEAFFGKRWQEPLRRRITETKTKTGKIKYIPLGQGTAGSRKILTGTGDLGRSIQYRVEGKKVVVYSDLDYSKIHNEGGTVTVTEKMKRFFWAKYITTGQEFYKNMALKKTGSTITIPKRQFMGSHDTINKAVKNTIETELNKIFKI
ncbi:MAG: phage virion morphogenesis protein [Bacteroidales bacterium]|jgi:phage gpG-like protein